VIARAQWALQELNGRGNFETLLASGDVSQATHNTAKEQHPRCPHTCSLHTASHTIQHSHSLHTQHSNHTACMPVLTIVNYTLGLLQLRSHARRSACGKLCLMARLISTPASPRVCAECLRPRWPPFPACAAGWPPPTRLLPAACCCHLEGLLCVCTFVYVC
jgi:hypothetical protein